MNLPSLQSAYAIILDFDKTNLSLPYDEALSNIRNVMVQFQFKPLTNNVYVCTSSKNQLACFTCSSRSYLRLPGSNLL